MHKRSSKDHDDWRVYILTANATNLTQGLTAIVEYACEMKAI